MRFVPGSFAALLLAATLAAAGCAAPEPSASAPPASPIADAPPPVASTFPPAGQDTCRAADYRALVGADHRDVPVAPDGLVFRVACTTCPVTEDFNPRRITFYFDDADGRIVRLACG